MSAQKSKPSRKPQGHRLRNANIPGYRTEVQAAEELGMAVRTLRLWRHDGEGPAYVKFGRQILYRAEALATFVKSREIIPVRELAPA